MINLFVVLMIKHYLYGKCYIINNNLKMHIVNLLFNVEICLDKYKLLINFNKIQIFY